MSKYNAHVEEARANLDYAELSRLGKMGARARWAKRRAELEQKENLEFFEKARHLASAQKKIREAHEDICPPPD